VCWSTPPQPRVQYRSYTPHEASVPPTMTCQTVAVMPEDHQIILADKSLRRWSPGKHDAPGVGYIPIGGRRKICTPRRVALHSHWIAMIGC
jgi:hypothetical protein